AGLPLVATARSWREAVALIAVSAVLTLAIVAALLRDPPASQAGKSTKTTQPRLWIISRHEVWLVLISGAAFSLLNAGLVIFTSFAPSLLRQRGLGEIEAGVLTSWASWIMIATLPAAGYFLDRARPVTAWLLASTALSALVCVGLLS